MSTTERYAALLRGASPQNAKMPDVKRAFEAAGFTAVVTHASSGNVIFDAHPCPERELEARAEAALKKHLSRGFSTFVRPVSELRALLVGDAWRRFAVAPEAKRVVTLLRDALPEEWRPPPALDGATIHGADGRYVFTSYVPSPKGPVFMTLLQKTFGADITTRTVDALQKIAAR